MSTYCIGDLHGRYDLFIELLNKIKFSPEKDRIFLLGDVIDRHYGGNKILEYILNHQQSCCLILGNHEMQFLGMIKSYDTIMFNDEIKSQLKTTVEVYSGNLFEKIEEPFRKCMLNKDKNEFYYDPSIQKWINSGSVFHRKRLLNEMVELVETISYDEVKYGNIMHVLRNMNGMFETKMFVKELLEKDTDYYIKIIKFLRDCPMRKEISVQGKEFVLIHGKTDITLGRVYRKIIFHHADTFGKYYIYGHEPIGSIHKRLSFDFDYRRIFSFVDIEDNHYYNLDLGSNPIAALCLDDFSEYYVGQPPQNDNAWVVPEDTSTPPKEEFRIIENATIAGANFYTNAKKRYAFCTFKDGCYEYLIGVYALRNKIVYSPVGWLDYKPGFYIPDWYNGQSNEEIIMKVREDFEQKLLSGELENLRKELYGTTKKEI